MFNGLLRRTLNLLNPESIFQCTLWRRSLLLPYAPWLCWLIPVIGAVFTPIFARINPKLRNYAPVAFAAAAVVFSFSMIPDVFTGKAVNWVSGEVIGRLPLDWQLPWISSLGLNAGVLVDFLSVLMVCVVGIIGLLVTVFSIEYMREKRGLTRYWLFLQLFIGGLGMIVMADNFLQLYIGWEIVGIGCVALVTFWYKDPHKAHCGLKTFMILRIGDVLLLASILIMYFYSGTFNFKGIESNMGWMSELPRIALVTALMLFGGAIAKSAQFPLHEWLPDAMPATPASFNAITEVLAGVYLVARTLPIFQNGLPNSSGELTIFFLIVAWIGTFTALLGASLAMVQRSIVRVLAYSIMSQYAYMIVSLGIGGLMTNPTAGYLGGILHLMVDAIASGLLFLSAGAILHRVQSQDMFDMGGLKARMPITFKCMIIGALATIGIPPLSGFWSEETIYSATLGLGQELGDQGRFTLMLSAYGIYIILMATAAITTFYVIRMMGVVFGRKSKHIKNIESKGLPLKEVSPTMWVPMGIAAVATVVIGVLAPFVIAGFHEFLPPLLHQSVVHEGFADILIKAFLSPGFVITCIAVAIGAYPAYRLYVACKVDPVKLTKEHAFLQKLHRFLWNRCYFDSVNYALASFFRKSSKLIYTYLERSIDMFNYAIAGFFKRLSSGMYKYPELKGIDALNYFLADRVTSFARRFRKTHTGVLSYNMLTAFVGAIILIILLLLFGGVIS
jgi:NADH-quinone oxidoreductase subunit L